MRGGVGWFAIKPSILVAWFLPKIPTVKVVRSHQWPLRRWRLQSVDVCCHFIGEWNGKGICLSIISGLKSRLLIFVEFTQNNIKIGLLQREFIMFQHVDHVICHFICYHFFKISKFQGCFSIILPTGIWASWTSNYLHFWCPKGGVQRKWARNQGSPGWLMFGLVRQ